jgi:hypothetical protein
MTNAKPVGVDKATTLADTNIIVVQNEQLIGALIGMGNLADQTVLTFDADQYNPAKNAVIVKKADPAPAGAAQVCEGTIFVEGALTDCVAYR